MAGQKAKSGKSATARSETNNSGKGTGSKSSLGAGSLAIFGAVVAVAVGIGAAVGGKLGALWEQRAVGNVGETGEVKVEPPPQVASTSPRVFVFDDLLTDAECEFLKNHVVARLKPAGVVLETENKYKVSTEWRNNEQVWLTQQEENQLPIVRKMIKRMHRVARIPIEMAEGLQIGRYMNNQKYESHVDTDPAHDVTRPMTLLMYLSDVESGGHTVFPAENRSKCQVKWHKVAGEEDKYGCQNCCDLDFGGMIRVSPKKGRGILFFNHDLKGSVDKLSEHAACPMKKGVKWIAQRWFRYVPYQRNAFFHDPNFDGLPLESTVKSDGPWNGNIHVLSDMAPRIYLLENFLSAEECKHLLELAMRGLESPATGDFLISEQVELEDPIVAAVAKRMHRAAYYPEDHAEKLQVKRYSAGGSMDLHSDYSSAATRPVTMIVYLNDVDGGETVYPKGTCGSIEDCCRSGSKALRVPPKAGRAVLHYSVDQEVKFEKGNSKHGSCPVQSGEKWIIQRFFRKEPTLSLQHSPDPVHDLTPVDNILRL